MMALLNKLAPSATDMIRADHTRVLAAFHRYDVSGTPALKQAIVSTICLALEVHAQIEEEIFYPAMRAIDPGVIALMRNVMHHVADEETTLLMDADKRLADRIGALGAQMTQRRLQLMRPHVGEMALNSVRAMPKNMVLLGAGALAAAAGLFIFARRR